MHYLFIFFSSPIVESSGAESGSASPVFHAPPPLNKDPASVPQQPDYHPDM